MILVLQRELQGLGSLSFLAWFVIHLSILYTLVGVRLGGQRLTSFRPCRYLRSSQGAPFANWSCFHRGAGRRGAERRGRGEGGARLHFSFLKPRLVSHCRSFSSSYSPQIILMLCCATWRNKAWLIRSLSGFWTSVEMATRSFHWTGQWWFQVKYHRFLGFFSSCSYTHLLFSFYDL